MALLSRHTSPPLSRRPRNAHSRHGVAAPGTYGCSPWHLWLQPLAPMVAGGRDAHGVLRQGPGRRAAWPHCRPWPPAALEVPWRCSRGALEVPWRCPGGAAASWHAAPGPCWWRSQWSHWSRTTASFSGLLALGAGSSPPLAALASSLEGSGARGPGGLGRQDPAAGLSCSGLLARALSPGRWR